MEMSAEEKIEEEHKVEVLDKVFKFLKNKEPMP